MPLPYTAVALIQPLVPYVEGLDNVVGLVLIMLAFLDPLPHNFDWRVKLCDVLVEFQPPTVMGEEERPVEEF